MRHLELSPRLRLLAGWVPPGARVADVGTDHAYLPVWLTLHGRVASAIASDLREGPLARARETGRTYGTERVDFRLCDGLSGIRPDEADTVVIAGMGGETIAAILSAAPWVRERDVPLILQPMSSFPDLRSWLHRSGFAIQEERLAREGDTLYTALLVRAGEMGPQSPAELWAGKNGNTPLRGDWLDRWIARTGRAIDGMSRARGEGILARKLELEEVREGLMNMKKEWEQWQK